VDFDAIYGQYTNSVLKNLTQNEPPWKNSSPKEEISLNALNEYFQTQVVYTPRTCCAQCLEKNKKNEARQWS
jgi:hypothetical protein